MDDQQKPKKDQGLADQVALLSFIDTLITQKKDPNVNEKNMNQVRALLMKELNDDINEHLIQLLTEKDQLAMEDLLDKNPTDEEITSFYQQKVPNLTAEIASVMLNFRAAYLGLSRGQAQQQAQTQAATDGGEDPTLIPAPISPSQPDKVIN